MRKFLTCLVLFTASLCHEPVALAQGAPAAVENPAPKGPDAAAGASVAPAEGVAAPAAALTAVECPDVAQVVVPKPPLEETVTQLFHAIGDLKGLGLQGILIALVTLLVSAMKVSALRPFWDKLGPWKTVTAPFLSLVLVGVSTVPTGMAFDWKALAVAVTTGAGAIALHEFLDALKKAPGIGPVFGTAIGLLQSILNRKGKANGGAQTAAADAGADKGPGGNAA